jgi:hypothetical protein
MHHILINANLRGCFRVLACFPCTKMAAAHTTVQAPHSINANLRGCFRVLACFPGAKEVQAPHMYSNTKRYKYRCAASSLLDGLGVLGGLLQWGGHKVVRGCYRCARAAAQIHAAHRSSIGVLGGLLARGRTVVVQASSLPGVLAKYGYDYALVTWMRTLLLVGDQQLNGYGMHEHVYISFIECAEYAC